jgi:hypothetical protein
VSLVPAHGLYPVGDCASQSVEPVVVPQAAPLLGQVGKLVEEAVLPLFVVSAEVGPCPLTSSLPPCTIFPIMD